MDYARRHPAFAVGMVVIVGTHVWRVNNSLPDAFKTQHALVNLVASGLILYSVLQS